MGVLGRILYNINNMRKAKKIKNMDKAELLAFEDEAFLEAVGTVCESEIYDIKTDTGLTNEQRWVYTLINFEREMNNGGLCQFFANSSGDCASFVSQALEQIGAFSMKNLFDEFIEDNGIDLSDLSLFKINSIEEYEAKTQIYDFDRFDEKFYEMEDIHPRIIAYARKNLDKIVY